ncbi:MAG: hypothetical protein KDA24_28905 [Deltaproteobacteria bacterium]|nr:hypothetical protein [Deltaproteobacteria bacterium]
MAYSRAGESSRRGPSLDPRRREWTAPRQTDIPPYETLAPTEARSVARALTAHRDGWRREPAVAGLGAHSTSPDDLDVLLPRTRWGLEADDLVLEALATDVDTVRERLLGEHPWGLRVGLMVPERAGESMTSRALLPLRASDVRSALHALGEVDRAGVSESEWREIFQAALGSRRAPMRAWAVRRWDQLGFDGAREVLEAEVVDRARAVRWVGQYRLGKKGQSPVEIARARFDEDVSVGAIEALGETGTEEDLSRLEPLLDGRPAVARAALRAIAGIDSDAGAEWAVVHLPDARSDVVREAGSVLRTSRILPTMEELVELVVSPPHPRIPLRPFPLLSRLPKYESLEGLLRVAAAPGESAPAERVVSASQVVPDRQCGGSCDALGSMIARLGVTSGAG